MGALTVLLFILMLAVLGVLLCGVVLMATGGKANSKYANKLMMARVILQGCALAVVALIFVMGGKG